MDKDKIIEQIKSFIIKLNEKNPYYLLLGIIFFILLFDYLIILQFQLRAMSSLNPKIKTLSEEIKSMGGNLQRLPQFQEEIDRLTQQLEKSDNRIKAREQIPMILENLSVVANRSGVRIEQIIPDTGTEEPIMKNDEGEYFAVPINIEAQSSYHDFGRFLNQLEIEGNFIDIPEFTIAASRQDSRKHVIKLTVKAVIFEKTK